MTLEGLVGNTNYDSSEFQSNTAYQFSQFLDFQETGLYDTPTNPTIYPDVTIPTDSTVTIDPGETLDEALDFGAFDGSGGFTYTDAVGSSDPVDLYQFNITQNNNFNFVLGGLSADADLQLVDSNGDILVASENYNTDAEILTASLPAGTYYLGVAFYDGIDTSYNLSVFAGENASSPAEIDAVVDPSLTTDFALV